MSTAPKRPLTEAEYLAIEREAETKSEFYDGEMFAMAGARRNHNLIVSNVVGALNQQLREGPCEVYPGDMRVKVAKTGLYAYPDVVVACSDPRFWMQKSIRCSTQRCWSKYFPNQRRATFAI